jgi:hypothetical protein
MEAQSLDRLLVLITDGQPGANSNAQHMQTAEFEGQRELWGKSSALHAPFVLKVCERRHFFRNTPRRIPERRLLVSIWWRRLFPLPI